MTHTHYNQILVLPDAGPKNPFQYQMIAFLRQHGLKVSLGAKYKLFSIYKGVHLVKPEIIYFDWVHSFILGKNLMASLLKSLVFIAEIIYVVNVRKIPIIHTAHNLENHSKKRLKLERIVYGFFLNRCYKIRVYSDAARKNIVEKFRLNINRIHIIQDIPYHYYYPNDTNKKDSRTRLAIPQDAVLFLFFGRIQPYKGLENLIHSFLKMNKSDHYLIIAGESIDANYESRLRKLAHTHTRIIWHQRFIDKNDVQYFFQAADVIVLPFIESDHSGSVDLALSFTKAVITLKTEATKKLLAHQEFLLFGNPSELSFCLTKATESDLVNIGKHNYKILFCTNTFENIRNGPAKFANYLLEMNRLFQNVEIRILTEDISDYSTHQYRHYIYKPDLKLNPFTKSWGFVYRMFPYYRACLEIKSTFAYDIVVFNNAITGIWSSIFLNTPVIGMINDDNSLSIRWKNFNYSQKWFRHFIFYYLEKLACFTESGILVNSGFLFNQVSKNYKIRPKKLHVLHKAVKTCTFPPDKSLDFQCPVKILFVKSDFVRGGLFDLISALGSLKSYDFELQIIGPEVTHKQEILNNNKYPNLAITFIGPAPPEVVKNRMLNNDLFIVPSRREAFGVANLEALAHGLSVISTKTGGIPEALNFGNNGWMVPPRKPKKLARLIEYVIEHPQERFLKQKNGFDYVENNFSIEKVLNNFLEILNRYVS